MVVEADIDKHFAEAVSAAGGVGKRIAYRGERGAADWLVGFPFNRLFIVELKRPKGGRIARLQEKDAELWFHVGVEKVWLRTYEEVNRWTKKVRA